MRDPERLLDQGSRLESRLLASAVDEPPPPDLLGRTLDLVAAAPLPAAASTAAVGASAKAGGVLSAAGIGAALGLLVVGGFALATRPAATPAVPSIMVSASAPPVAAPPTIPVAPTAPSTSSNAPAPSAPRPLTLAAELALLDEARSALRAGDRAGALALLDRYAREIPRGQLAREAALLRAEAEGDAAIDAGTTIP